MSSAAAPKVSAIIVNRNGAGHLRICLPSLLAQSFTSLEIIVVDNRSSDDSAEVARSFGVRWLPLVTNVGLAPALNYGAAAAIGEFLLFLNNDMRFDPQFVAELAKPLDQDAGLFATDGMQFNWDDGVRGHMAARLTDHRQRHPSSTELVPGLYFYQSEAPARSLVFMASAACMMARKSLFEKLGGFDSRLPFGCEDVELCWRAWLRGQKTLYVPQAICWHRVGSSARSKEGERFAFRGVLIGRLLFASKLLPGRYALRTWLASIAGLGKDLIRLRWRLALDRLGVLFDMARLLPQLLHERKQLFRDARVSPDDHLKSLLRLTTNPEGS